MTSPIAGQNNAMARYVVHVRSPRSPTDSFAYMADQCNFAEWDTTIVAQAQSRMLKALDTITVG